MRTKYDRKDDDDKIKNLILLTFHPFIVNFRDTGRIIGSSSHRTTYGPPKVTGIKDKPIKT